MGFFDFLKKPSSKAPSGQTDPKAPPAGPRKGDAPVYSIPAEAPPGQKAPAPPAPAPPGPPPAPAPKVEEPAKKIEAPVQKVESPVQKAEPPARKEPPAEKIEAPVPKPQPPVQKTESPVPKIEPPAPPPLPPPAAKSPPTPSSPPAIDRSLAKRILFVGADPAWSGHFEKELALLEPAWSCLGAPDAGVAEALLASANFHFLVLEGRTSHAAILLEMPEKNVKNAICVVRGDLSDREAVARWTGAGVTPLSEDIDTAAFVAGLKRAERLRDWMTLPALNKLISQIRKLPVEPKLYGQVTDELQSPSGSMQVVAKLIARDPVMAAKILQVTNSAFFGRAEVTDIGEAVMVLGSERIKSLILLAGVFSQYIGARCPGFSPEPIWSHSLQAANFARLIANEETKNARIADIAFTAGLLHDVGKLVLAANLPDTYDAVRRMQSAGKMTLKDAETAIMGTTHAEMGACLLGTWGLPLSILEAIAWHHSPEQSDEKGFSLLAVVHVANVLAQESGFPSEPGVSTRISAEFLKDAGLGDCRNRWRDICGLEAKPDVAETSPPQPGAGGGSTPKT